MHLMMIPNLLVPEGNGSVNFRGNSNLGSAGQSPEYVVSICIDIFLTNFKRNFSIFN